MVDPLSNPQIPRTEGVKDVTSDVPKVAGDDRGQEPQPFSLGPEPLPGQGQVTAAEQAGKPTPMQVAGEGHGAPAIPKEELNSRMESLVEQLKNARDKVQQGEANLTPDHEKALSRLVQKLNPEFRNISNKMGVEYKPPVQQKKESVVGYVTKWIDGSQKTLSDALAAYSKVDNMDPASYFTLQAAVQRASERAELFASIVGAGVSGLKTIMSMQLG